MTFQQEHDCGLVAPSDLKPRSLRDPEVLARRTALLDQRWGSLNEDRYAQNQEGHETTREQFNRLLAHGYDEDEIRETYGDEQPDGIEDEVVAAELEDYATRKTASSGSFQSSLM